MSIVDHQEPHCFEPNQGDTVELLMQARARDLGGFTVGRMLPAVQRRAVGPFVFLDLMGPVALAPGAGMDVRPHPHIGLSTVTYLLSGESMHRDSLGTVQVVRAGDLNVMTAGRGVVHSERMDPAQRAQSRVFQGAQIWLALPEQEEDCEPSFTHVAQHQLPAIAPAPGASGRVLLGAAFGAQSPVVHPSAPLLVDLHLPAGASLELPCDVPERGVFMIEGEARIGELAVERERLAVLRPGRPAPLTALASTRVLLLGGPPVGHRFLEWNFVSSSQAKIERAREAWKAQTFPKIPGDDREYVPLPDWPVHSASKAPHQ